MFAKYDTMANVCRFSLFKTPQKKIMCSSSVHALKHLTPNAILYYLCLSESLCSRHMFAKFETCNPMAILGTPVFLKAARIRLYVRLLSQSQNIEFQMRGFSSHVFSELLPSTRMFAKLEHINSMVRFPALLAFQKPQNTKTQENPCVRLPTS
jgi:hypothetical protein